jgi:hypothetical protein
MLSWRTKAVLLVVALITSLVHASSLGAGGAYACSCAQAPTLAEESRTSDAVFSGEVLDIEENELAPGPGPPLGRVTFDVREAWKGVSEESIVVYGQGNEVSCGIDFEKDRSYLVYAYRSSDGPGDHLETGFCNATKPLAEAEADLLMLRSTSATLPDTGGFVSLKRLGFLVVALATNLVL